MRYCVDPRHDVPCELPCPACDEGCSIRYIKDELFLTTDEKAKLVERYGRLFNTRTLEVPDVDNT